MDIRECLEAIGGACTGFHQVRLVEIDTIWAALVLQRNRSDYEQINQLLTLRQSVEFDAVGSNSRTNVTSECQEYYSNEATKTIGFVPLSLDGLSGVFVVFVSGSVMAIGSFFVEMILLTKMRSRQDQVAKKNEPTEYSYHVGISGDPIEFIRFVNSRKNIHVTFLAKQ